MKHTEILEQFVKAVHEKHSDEVQIRNEVKIVELKQPLDSFGLYWQDNMFADYQDSRFAVSSIARSVDGIPNQVVLFSDGDCVKRYELNDEVLVLDVILLVEGIDQDFLERRMVISMDDLESDMNFYKGMISRLKK